MQNRPPNPVRRIRQTTQAQWARHRERLLQLREHFLPSDQKGRTKAVAHSPPSDPAGGRFDNYDQNLALALLAHEHNPLQELDAALKRIDEGVFGICERTGAPIDPARLNALPWARSCSRSERRQQQMRRLAHH